MFSDKRDIKELIWSLWIRVKKKTQKIIITTQGKDFKALSLKLKEGKAEAEEPLPREIKTCHYKQREIIVLEWEWFPETYGVFHSAKCRYFAEILNIAMFHHSNSRQGCGGRGKECEENQMACHLAQLQATQKETELAGNCGSQEIERDGN